MLCATTPQPSSWPSTEPIPVCHPLSCSGAAVPESTSLLGISLGWTKACSEYFLLILLLNGWLPASRLSKSIIFNRNCSLDHQVHKTVSRFYYQQIRFPGHRKKIPWQNQDEVSDDFVNLLSGMGSQKTDLVLSFLPSCHCGLGINSPCFIYHQNFQSRAKTERHIFPL